jgi:hypothetical protein
MHEEQIRAWWESENGLEDCNMCRWADFSLVVRAVEQKLASLAKPQPVGGALTDEQLIDEMPADVKRTAPWYQGVWLRYARRVLALATLSAPVAQPGEASHG